MLEYVMILLCSNIFMWANISIITILDNICVVYQIKERQIIMRIDSSVRRYIVVVW